MGEATSEASAPDQPRGPAPVASAARRRGRLVALVLYWAIAVAICAAAAVQVTSQLFGRPVAPSPYPSCRDGLRALLGAVERARRAAPEVDGEDAALARYRAALEPEWSYRDGVALACRGSHPDERALDAIERLRYAEEHAVRREAGELAPLRRRVQALVDGVLKTE